MSLYPDVTRIAKFKPNRLNILLTLILSILIIIAIIPIIPMFPFGTPPIDQSVPIIVSSYNCQNKSALWSFVGENRTRARDIFDLEYLNLTQFTQIHINYSVWNNFGNSSLEIQSELYYIILYSNYSTTLRNSNNQIVILFTSTSSINRFRIDVFFDSNRNC